MTYGDVLDNFDALSELEFRKLAIYLKGVSYPVNLSDVFSQPGLGFTPTQQSQLKGLFFDADIPLHYQAFLVKIFDGSYRVEKSDGFDRVIDRLVQRIYVELPQERWQKYSFEYLNELIPQYVSIERFFKLLNQISKLPYPLNCERSKIVDELVGLSEIEKHIFKALFFRGDDRMKEHCQIVVKNEKGLWILAENFSDKFAKIIANIDWNNVHKS